MIRRRTAVVAVSGPFTAALFIARVTAGSKYIAKGVPVKFRHSEAQLAQYGVEIEFEQEIRRQWWLSMIAGVLLVVSFVFSVSILLGHRED